LPIPNTNITLGDVAVARIGLGTNRLRDTDAGVCLVEAAVEAGIQMIDTAHSYTGGQSESAIGKALAGVGRAHIVATKGGWGGPGHGRPELLKQEITESLQRLETETIDLYYLHRVDPETPLEESLSVIKDYRDRGKIRHIGVSEVDVEQIERARKAVPIAAVQNHYNLSERTYDEVVDYCAREGIVFVPFYPLGGDGGSILNEISRRRHATPQQITLAWLLRRSPAMLPIPGTLSVDHLHENVAAMKIELSDKEFDSLDLGGRN
jgi:pyridoxine 4-dehydrogenase